MAKKKDRKAVEKRRAKSRQEKQKKRRLKFVQQRHSGESHDEDFLSDVVWEGSAPKGFRAVSISQALVEFGKPLMDRLGDDPEALNSALNISTAIWNFGFMLEERDEEGQKRALHSILENIESTLELDEHAAAELFKGMMERKEHLFPEDIQPGTPMRVFMRKEVSHVITPFDYEGLEYARDPIPPDEHDRNAIAKMEELDRYISDGAEYDEWEDLYLAMEEAVQDRFEKWLEEKNLAEWSRLFIDELEPFLDYIYRYQDDPVILRLVPPVDIEDFLFDYLLRKVVAEPHEYAGYPAMLKFFYEFLQEKGYIGKPESLSRIAAINEMEPDFIDELRVEFS
jgi:hypothetical protein